jgi:hypothetical protein
MWFVVFLFNATLQRFTREKEFRYPLQKRLVKSGTRKENLLSHRLSNPGSSSP